MRIDVPLLRRLHACDGGIARFRAEFRHKPIELTEDLWERTPCVHLVSSDWSWLAGRILLPEDAEIYRQVMDASNRTREMTRLADTDWRLYCRKRARVALAVLGALIPLCDVRQR